MLVFVTVHYNAYQELEAEPFDSTRLRHQMEKFRLGIGLFSCFFLWYMHIFC